MQPGRLIWNLASGPQAFALAAPRTVVGRCPTGAALPPGNASVGWLDQGEVAYIAIAQHTLARRHFEVERREDGGAAPSYFIRDLGSHCGIEINGQRFSDEGWHPLGDGDVLLFGWFRFEAARAGPPARSPGEPP